MLGLWVGHGDAASRRNESMDRGKRRSLMTKTFALLAAFALMFAVAGCPDKGGDKKDDKATTPTEKKDDTKKDGDTTPTEKKDDTKKDGQ